MSVAVDLGALRAQIDRCGVGAFVVTTADDGSPHVASVLVRMEGDELVMGAGRTTRANAATRAPVTLLWAAAGDDEYCLIVDGRATAVRGEELLVTPASAVLHRLAGAPADRAQCLPLDGRSGGCG